MLNRMTLFFWPSTNAEDIDKGIANPDYAAAIQLLKTVKLIDDSDNPVIDPAIQKMIEKELLSLPRACKDLLFYSTLIDKGIQKHGDVAVHCYGNIAWAEMRKHIAAIEETPLPWAGGNPRFVPCEQVQIRDYSKGP